MVKKEMGRLCLQLRPGNKIHIGDDIVLELDCRNGPRSARLIITAPIEVPVNRTDHNKYDEAFKDEPTSDPA